MCQSVQQMVGCTRTAILVSVENLQTGEPLPLHTDLLNLDFRTLYTKPKLFKFGNQLIAIDQINSRCSISCCFAHGILRKITRRNQQAFISTTDHCAPKIPHLASTYRPLISFTLEDDVETE